MRNIEVNVYGTDPTEATEATDEFKKILASMKEGDKIEFHIIWKLNPVTGRELAVSEFIGHFRNQWVRSQAEILKQMCRELRLNYSGIAGQTGVKETTLRAAGTGKQLLSIRDATKILESKLPLPEALAHALRELTITKRPLTSEMKRATVRRMY